MRLLQHVYCDKKSLRSFVAYQKLLILNLNEIDPYNNVLLKERVTELKRQLEYYSKLFEYDKIFDQVYVTGWDPLSKLPKFKMGGNLQNNPPLFPELYAALGALKFFSKDNMIYQPLYLGHFITAS